LRGEKEDSVPKKKRGHTENNAIFKIMIDSILPHSPKNGLPKRLFLQCHWQARGKGLFLHATHLSQNKEPNLDFVSQTSYFNGTFFSVLKYLKVSELIEMKTFKIRLLHNTEFLKAMS
jgi:hypothetical protein